MDREEKTRISLRFFKNLPEVLEYIAKTTVKNENISTLQ